VIEMVCPRLRGSLRLAASPSAAGLQRITVRVMLRFPLGIAQRAGREAWKAERSAN
jgi:hypothetical protein